MGGCDWLHNHLMPNKCLSEAKLTGKTGTEAEVANLGIMLQQSSIICQRNVKPDTDASSEGCRKYHMIHFIPSPSSFALN